MIPILMLAALGAADPAVAAPDPRGRETQAQAEAHAAALHARMDGDGDGYVTPTEMAQFIARRMNGLPIPGTDAAHPLPPLSAALFAAADTDHDGRVSLAEAMAGAGRDFALADTDHDGVVTPDERMAFITRELAGGRTPEGVPLTPAR